MKNDLQEVLMGMTDILKEQQETLAKQQAEIEQLKASKTTRVEQLEKEA